VNILSPFWPVLVLIGGQLVVSQLLLCCHVTGCFTVVVNVVLACIGLFMHKSSSTCCIGSGGIVCGGSVTA
jgi:hypothetical protein